MYLHHVLRCGLDKVVDRALDMSSRDLVHSSLDQESVPIAIISRRFDSPELISTYVSKNLENFAGSSVALMITIFNSVTLSFASFSLPLPLSPFASDAFCSATSFFRILCIRLSAPQMKSVLRVRSCASSTTTTSYRSKRLRLPLLAVSALASSLSVSQTSHVYNDRLAA